MALSLINLLNTGSHMIKIGDIIPEESIKHILNEETSETTTRELFANKKVVLFAVPGAFTPTCSLSDLPGYITNFEKFKEKEVDIIACLSVNDSFVMKAWAKDQNAENIMMLADGGAELTKAFGLEMNTGSFGGLRSRRYAMIIENNQITHINLDDLKKFEVSNAESMLALLL